jgi:hypothetical protein
MTTLLIAMDRAIGSVRSFDQQGFLHVEKSNISKANVCPYMGREIPNWQALGLDGDRVYQMYRHPDELAKAVPTFRNLPLLCDHVPVDADTIPPELIVGSTGSDVAFDGQYLTANPSVWKRNSIEGVLSNRKREMSSAYSYDADMTAGETEGVQYDGIMRNIRGNHVALVITGRAGPDVVVGDEQMKLGSRTALMISGATAAMVRPLLAQDAQVDLAPVLKDVTAASIAMDGAPAALASKIVAAVKPHLAADKALTEADVIATLALVPAVTQDDALGEPAPAPKPAPVTPPPAVAVGMDEASVKALVDGARASALAEQAAIRTAEREVEPHIGQPVAMDSAADVYRTCLEAKGVKLDGVAMDAKTLGAMVRMLPLPGATPAPRVAMDAARTGKFAAMFPNAAVIGVS